MASSTTPDLAKVHTHMQWNPQDPIVETEPAPPREPTPDTRDHGVPSISRQLKGKGRDRVPCDLLGLPVDILRLIVAEVGAHIRWRRRRELGLEGAS